jgi:hypothetical protein
MNFRKIKKITFAMTLALGFTGAPSLSGLSTVQAQEPRPQERGREQMEKRVIMEERTGYRDGYRMGREDARSHRRSNYNRSRQYQRGDRYYRDDFRKGYAKGYRHG